MLLSFICGVSTMPKRNVHLSPWILFSQRDPTNHSHIHVHMHTLLQFFLPKQMKNKWMCCRIYACQKAVFRERIRSTNWMIYNQFEILNSVLSVSPNYKKSLILFLWDFNRNLEKDGNNKMRIPAKRPITLLNIVHNKNCG